MTATCSQKSAGIVLWRGKKILLLDRAFFPFGWACPAGHLKKGEDPKIGALRELKEETGLLATSPKLVLAKKRIKNKCVKGSKYHDWFVFEAKAKGRLKINKSEAKEIKWFLPQDIKKLKLESIWLRWLKELNII